MLDGESSAERELNSVSVATAEEDPVGVPDIDGAGDELAAAVPLEVTQPVTAGEAESERDASEDAERVAHAEDEGHADADAAPDAVRKLEGLVVALCDRELLAVALAQRVELAHADADAAADAETDTLGVDEGVARGEPDGE